MFGLFLHYADFSGKATVAMNDYKYWSGADQPWRNGVDDSPVTDQGVIASEEQRKREANDALRAAIHHAKAEALVAYIEETSPGNQARQLSYSSGYQEGYQAGRWGWVDDFPG